MATYRITATPLLYTNGAFKGNLKGVSFTAVSCNDTKEWFSNNCGQFELQFSKLMPQSLAAVIVSALKQGDEIEFPGVYDERQFEHGFYFEWSPAHFMTPAQAFQESMV